MGFGQIGSGYGAFIAGGGHSPGFGVFDGNPNAGSPTYQFGNPTQNYSRVWTPTPQNGFKGLPGYDTATPSQYQGAKPASIAPPSTGLGGVPAPAIPDATQPQNANLGLSTDQAGGSHVGNPINAPATASPPWHPQYVYNGGNIALPGGPQATWANPATISSQSNVNLPVPDFAARRAMNMSGAWQQGLGG